MAQDFKKIKVGLGFGYIPTSDFWSRLMYIEPAYRINDRWAIGFRMESNFADGNSNKLLTGSYGLNGQHYFLNTKLRPYGGLGIGLFTPVQSSMPLCDCSITYEKNKIGLYPRLGVDFGHLSVTMEYNFVAASKISTSSMFTNSETTTGYLNNNYFSTKVGLVIGGGRKK